MKSDIPELIINSRVVSEIYGDNDISMERWRDWGFALMTIAGADGIVSEPEQRWLSEHLEGNVGIGRNMIMEIRSFDYSNAQLEEIIARITHNLPATYRRALVYDAIRMSRADGDYAKEERKAVHKAANFLKVDVMIASAIEQIIDMEDAIRKARLALFQFDSSRSIDSSVKENQALSMTPFFKSIYGSDITLYDSLVEYGTTLIIIAGADREISATERNWLLCDYAKLMNVPDSIVDLWNDLIQTAAYNSMILTEHAAKIITQGDAGRQLIYDAIHMSSADGYVKKEHVAVMATAAILGIEVEIVREFEKLVESEVMVDTMRRSIFKVQGDAHDIA